VLSGDGDLAPALDLIVRCRIGKAAARALRRWFRSPGVRTKRVMWQRSICVLGRRPGLMVALG
jgi:hypothetical protein